MINNLKKEREGEEGDGLGEMEAKQMNNQQPIFNPKSQQR